MTAAPPALAQQRCWEHPERSAAARCPSCRRTHCRECVTEHAGRVICTSCLRRQHTAAPTRAGLRGNVLLVGCAIAGLLVTWFVFYLLGSWALLFLPGAGASR